MVRPKPSRPRGPGLATLVFSSDMIVSSKYTNFVIIIMSEGGKNKKKGKGQQSCPFQVGSMAVFLAALGADARKLQMIGGDDTACGGFIQHALGQCHMIQIQNLSALGTDEVGVGFCPIVKPFKAVHNADGLNDILLFEHGDVPIDGAQTEIGKAGLQLPVDPFGGGMAFGLTDAV